MTTVVGKINNLVSKETQYGTMWNIEVDGKSYGAGKFPPKGVVVGDHIKFEADTSGRFFKMDVKSVTKVEAPVASASPAFTPAASRGFDDRQINITRQGCRNAAVAWMTFLASQNAIEIKKTATAGERLEALDAMLEQYVDEFVAFTTNGRTSPFQASASDEEVAGSYDD